MRKSFVFLILWILLLIFRSESLFNALAQFRVAKGLQTVYMTPPPATDQGRANLESVIEQKRIFFNSSVDAGVELILLGALCAVYFIKWPDSGNRNSARVIENSPAKT